jgi:oxalate/formate antiporter
MMAISSPQYVWALFVGPVSSSLRVGIPALQVTIALFSIFQAGFGPVHGYIAEKITARQAVIIGGAITGLSWLASSFVNSLGAFYVSYGVLSGIGTGIVFVTVTNFVARWFPDRRGLAVGMAAGSYGMGAVVTTFPISWMMKDHDFRYALLVFGIILGIVCMLAGAGMKEPPANPTRESDTAAAPGAVRNYTPTEMLKTPVFWMLFVMMAMVGTGGLMAISNIAVFAGEFGITPTTTVLGLSAVPLALTLDRICNGVSRPLFGWISDFIGREKTMALAFVIAAAAVLLLLYFHSPVLFVVLTGLVFLAWGEIFSLFPATQADIFGSKYGAKNFGFLFVAIAVSSLLGGPLAAQLFQRTGSWTAVFYSVAALDLIAAAMALFVLLPMRLRRQRS